MRKWKIILIAAVILFSLWELYPSAEYYSMSSEERDQLPSERTLRDILNRMNYRRPEIRTSTGCPQVDSQK